MLLALLLLSAATRPASAFLLNPEYGMFTVDTHIKYCDHYKVGPFEWSNCDRVEKSGSSCTLYVKNGWWGRTVSRQGPDDNAARWIIRFEDSTDLDHDTWLWTSCDDALIIDRVTLRGDPSTGQYSRGAYTERTWLNNDGDALCLSTDEYDYRGLDGYEGGKPCDRTYLFAPDGDVYYYFDRSWTPPHTGPRGQGRRSLAGVPVPTLEDVKECEKDESRDQEECEDLVDQIFKYEMEHRENLVKYTEEMNHLPEKLEEGIPESDVGNTDNEPATDDRQEEDIPEIDAGNTDSETATDDRRVLRALKRLLKASE